MRYFIVFYVILEKEGLKHGTFNIKSNKYPRRIDIIEHINNESGLPINIIELTKENFESWVDENDC